MMDEKKAYRQAHSIASIRQTDGWNTLNELIEEIRHECFEEWTQLGAQDLSTKKAFEIKGNYNGFNKLKEKLEDLESLLKRHSKQR